MTIHLVCGCGAEMTIEDGSEDRIIPALRMWFDTHRCGPPPEEKDGARD